MKQRLGIIFAASVFFFFAVFEFVRAVTGKAWPGLFSASNVVDVIYIPAWLAAGVGLLFKFSWGWVIGTISAVLAIVHGIGINVGGSKDGTPFALIGFMIVALIIYGKPWTQLRK